MNDTKLAKKSLQALAKSIGEAIGKWEETEGFEVSSIRLTAGGVYIVACNHPNGVAIDSEIK